MSLVKTSKLEMAIHKNLYNQILEGTRAAVETHLNVDLDTEVASFAAFNTNIESLRFHYQEYKRLKQIVDLLGDK